MIKTNENNSNNKTPSLLALPIEQATALVTLPRMVFCMRYQLWMPDSDQDLDQQPWEQHMHTGNAFRINYAFTSWGIFFVILPVELQQTGGPMAVTSDAIIYTSPKY